ncbi:MAG TPA: HipA domain-containing protein [Ilumatobacter sp.]|nr:HipA domain-containing protein [Ilumatobacter sp.]
MVDDLVVWRGNEVHAVLSERRGRLALTYQPEAQPVSVSMPVRASAYGDAVVRPWFRGLLPEGQMRLIIAYDIGVQPDDDFGLLRVLGKDCAGALSLREAGDVPSVHDIVGPALTQPEIGHLLRSLPTSPMGFDEGFRVSLPGNQHKLLLTQTCDAWHRPDGAPSTHILKPPIATLDSTTVANEAYCQWLATAAGLPAATTSIAEFDGVPVLISERFDRVLLGDGSTRRVHQEDGCQALSIDPKHKYESTDGRLTLRAIARVLADNGGELDRLLQAATFTVAIGNADWHGKNVSFTLGDDGGVSSAPIYDAMSTCFYDTSATGQRMQRTLGMFIGGVQDIDQVRRRDVVAEGRSWGLSAARAERLVNETCEALQSALESIEPPIEELRALVQTRLSILMT